MSDVDPSDGASSGVGGVAAPAKQKDSDFPPYASRPVLTGQTLLTVPHSFDSNKPIIQYAVDTHLTQFQLKPSWFGDIKEPTVYLNAQDPQMYYASLSLAAPRMDVWLLIKNTTFHGGGYVKRRLIEECFRRNIRCRLVNPNKVDLLLSNERSVVYAGTPIDLPDAVIPRVGANVDYFGLSVMRQLEQWGIKVYNPSASIEISRDKLYTHQILAANGLPIPKSVLSRSPFDLEYIEKHFDYPIILKLTSGSKGDAVWKLDNTRELTELISTLDTSRPIIFQEFLKDTRGRDLRCFVVGDKVTAAMMRIASSGFKANVHQGGSVRNVQCGEQLTALTVGTAKLCQLDFSGVDVLLDKNGYKICEVNSSPGFAGLEKATEYDVAKSIMAFVIDDVTARRQQHSVTTPMPTTWQSVPIQAEHATLGLA